MSETASPRPPLAWPASASALSAAVIPTLEGAQSYETVDSPMQVSASGEILPPTSRKKQFPRALRRLRDRLQTLEERLSLDVNALKQQIADLNMERSLLETKTTVARKYQWETAVVTVVEYYGAFQFGWIHARDTTTPFAGGPMSEPLKTSQCSSSVSIVAGDNGDTIPLTTTKTTARTAFVCERLHLLADRQRHFIHASLDHALQYQDMTCHGVDAFVDQWISFSRRHGDPRLALTSMTAHGTASEPIVVSLATLSGRLTRAALEELYPQSLTNDQLAERLLGAFIEYPCREFFHFDKEGRVVYYLLDVDFVGALQRILGRLHDVSSVLERNRKTRYAVEPVPHEQPAAEVELNPEIPLIMEF